MLTRVKDTDRQTEIETATVVEMETSASGIIGEKMRKGGYSMRNNA